MRKAAVESVQLLHHLLLSVLIFEPENSDSSFFAPSARQDLCFFSRGWKILTLSRATCAYLHAASTYVEAGAAISYYPAGFVALIWSQHPSGLVMISKQFGQFCWLLIIRGLVEWRISVGIKTQRKPPGAVGFAGWWCLLKQLVHTGRQFLVARMNMQV